MVPYSRKDGRLQLMHETIVRDLSSAVDSVRFSFSSHPLGWRRNRAEYLLDYANMLRTWKPFVDAHRGKGRYHGSITEFRMDPDIETGLEPIDDGIVLGHHVVRLGPILLVSDATDVGRPPINEVIGVAGRSARFRYAPCGYRLYTSDLAVRRGAWRLFAEAMIREAGCSVVPRTEQLRLWNGQPYGLRAGGLVRLQNCDGPFYGFEATFQENGIYDAVNVYPDTCSRRGCGIFEERRWELNALLEYKAEAGIGRRDRFQDATWEDVQSFVRKLQRRADALRSYNARAADYVVGRVVPLVRAYCEVLKDAGFSAEFVFDPNFTYFSGPLYNMGRAFNLFKALVSKPDEPLTAAEMREYYLTYHFDRPTKLSPVLLGYKKDRLIRGIPLRMPATSEKAAGDIVFEELDRLNGLRPKRSFVLNGVVQPVVWGHSQAEDERL
jgi:hypothetical protein